MSYPSAVCDHDDIVDLDADPFIPSEWTVVELFHQKGGQFKWDASRVELYLSTTQMGDGFIEGNELRNELKSLPVLNANLLDYLLKNTHKIPEEFKGKCVFFWGTVYGRKCGRFCVRYLCWLDSAWCDSRLWLECGWYENQPAAILKN